MGEVVRETHARLHLDESLPQQRVEQVFSASSASWPLAMFMALITDAIARIPVQYGETAVVEVEGDFNDTGHLRITYWRPETPEEIAKRIKSTGSQPR